MRLIVARCEVRYTGRLTAVLPEALRLLMVKSDGSVMVHADTGGYKPQNWMTPPTVIEEGDGRDRRAQARRRDRGPARDPHRRGALATSRTTWARRRRSRRTASSATCRSCSPTRRSCCGEGFRLVRREWPTDIGPVDLMCRDDEDGWIAVEIKRVGDDRRRRAADALPRAHPPRPGDGRRAAACSPRSRSSRRRACWPRRRGIDCVEVDLAVLRGEREPDLTLFA